MTVRRIDGDERSPRSSLRPQMAILTRHAVESAFPGSVDARCPPLVRNGNPRSKSQQFDVVDSCSPRLRTLSSSSASPVRRQQAKSGSARSSSFDKKGPTWVATTMLQSDLLVEVADMSFHLHKTAGG